MRERFTLDCLKTTGNPEQVSLSRVRFKITPIFSCDFF